MIDKVLRVPKECILAPLAQRLHQSVHPTAITIVGCGIGLVAAVAVWHQLYVTGLVLWVVNRILDGLDGTVARLQNRQSDLGAYLDVVLDHIVYAAIPLALALSINTVEIYLYLAFLLCSFYINGASWMYLSALLEKRKQGAEKHREQTTVRIPGGLIEGAETIVFFCLFLLLPEAAGPLFILMALFVLVTIVQRVLWAMHNLREREKQ